MHSIYIHTILCTERVCIAHEEIYINLQDKTDTGLWILQVNEEDFSLVAFALQQLLNMEYKKKRSCAQRDH